MLSFKEYLRGVLSEVWHSTIKSDWSKSAEIFKNPSPRELNSAKGEYKSTRALIHGKDIYAWGAEDASHLKVANHLRETHGLKGDMHGLTIDHSRGHLESADDKINPKAVAAIKSHPFIKKHFSGKKLYNYNTDPENTHII